MHMIARDRDAVELGHMRAGVSDDVRHNTHRRLRRINIGIADHELFKDVVLDSAV